MPRNNDRIVVVDLEATCWEDGMRPEGEKSDIIEIGISLLNMRTLEVEPAISIFVHPERSAISTFCTELTHITPRMVSKQGVPFDTACQRIIDRIGGPNKAWAAFGEDLKDIMHQCLDYKAPYPCGFTCYNVQDMMLHAFDLKRAPNLQDALKLANMEFAGTPHRACDDAHNTARLLAWLWKRIKNPCQK